MNSNNIIRLVIFILCLGLLDTAHAFVGTIAVSLGRMEDVGQVQTSFSADAVLETEEMTANTRIHYQPGMVRDEMNMGGQEMVTIRRFDLQKVWMILGQGMYMESAADEQNERAPDYKLISREVIGPEIVNGVATIKYKSVYESADGRFGGFTWFTDDNIAVKGFLVSETDGKKQRIKYEFTSLTRGQQDDALFEIPAGYQKFDMSAFAGMSGTMQQQGTTGTYGAPPAGATAPPPQSAPADGTAAGAAQDDTMVDIVADEAKRTAEDTAREETRRGVRESMRKGLGTLFGR